MGFDSFTRSSCDNLTIGNKKKKGGEGGGESGDLLRRGKTRRTLLINRPSKPRVMAEQLTDE